MTESKEKIRSDLQAAEQRLLDTLDDLIEMLGEGDPWVEHFRKVRAAIQRAKSWQTKNKAAARIRDVYGGMGSFNDWYIEASCDRGTFVNVRDQLYLLSKTYEDPRFARYMTEQKKDG